MVSDEEFLWFFNLAEQAKKEGCEGCSMKIFDFRSKYPTCKNYQDVYFFGKTLRDIQTDNQTVYLVYRKLNLGDIVTWHLVPNGYEGKLGRTNWRQKKWVEIQADNSKKMVFY